MAYDPLGSFEPICLLTRSPNVIVVNSASPFRSLTELLNEARAKPGNLTMAFQGPATSQHIGTEKLKRAAKVDMVNVPFLGAAPAVNALMGDHVAALFVNYPSVSEQVRAGSVRVLAAASRTRIEFVAGRSDHCRNRSNGFRRGRLVRSGRAGEDPEATRLSTCRLVPFCSAGFRDSSEACCSGIHRSWDVRRRRCDVPARPGRRLQPDRARDEYQGGMILAIPKLPCCGPSFETRPSGALRMRSTSLQQGTASC